MIGVHSALQPNYSPIQNTGDALAPSSVGVFATGPITHTTTLMATRYQDELSRGINNGTQIRSNIYHPVDVPKQFINAPKVLRISESELSGVALTDTLSVLGDRIQIALNQ